MTVIHDEIDLAPGKVRVKRGGGHAGHNGLRSIHQHISDQYQRVRLGVGHPGRKELVPHYVLQDFAKADADWLDDLMRGIGDGAPHLAAGAPDKFQNAIGLRMSPPRSAAPGAAKSKTAKPEAPKSEITTKPEPKSEAPSPPQDTRSALQRLADKFR